MAGILSLSRGAQFRCPMLRPRDDVIVLEDVMM